MNHGFIYSRAARLALVLVAASAFTGCSGSDEVAENDAGGVGPAGSSSTGSASSTSSSASSGVGASGVGGGISECDPGPTDAFLPNWVPPTPLHQGVCTPTQTADFVRCLTEGEGCAALMTDAPECYGCALSFVGTSAEYGPIYSYPELGVAWANQAGCVAATTGDTSDTSCGAKLLALDQCAMAACQACAEVGSGDAERYMACLEAAEHTSCEAYAKSSEECLQAVLAKGGKVLACDWPAGEPFDVYATGLVQLFCGEDSKVDPCPACDLP